MADFDPDAYLASKAAAAPAPAAGGDFDPDAYLRAKARALSAEMARPDRRAVGTAEAAGRGFLQGASMGFGDELTGAAEALLTDKKYAQARDESRFENQQAQDQHGFAYGAGQVAGGVASGLATAPLLPAAGTLGSAVGGGALVGAASGLGSSEADLTKGDALGALRDTAIGGAVGAAGGAVAHGLGKFVANAPKRLEERVISDLKGEGTKSLTTPTLGRALSENGDNVREAVKAAALKPMQAPTKIAAAVEKATEKFGGEIGEVYQEAAKAHPGITMRQLIEPVEKRAASYLDNPATESMGLALKDKVVGAIERTYGDRVVPKQTIAEALVNAADGELDDVAAKALDAKMPGIAGRIREAVASGKITREALASGDEAAQNAARDIMLDSIHVSPVKVHQFVSQLGKSFEGSGLSGGAAKELQRETWQAVKPVLTSHIEQVAPEAAQRLTRLNRIYSGLMDIGATMEDRVAKHEARRAFSGIDALTFGLGGVKAVAAKKALQTGLPLATRAADAVMARAVQSLRAGAPVAQVAEKAAAEGLPQPLIAKIVQAFGGGAQQVAEAQ